MRNKPLYLTVICILVIDNWLYINYIMITLIFHYEKWNLGILSFTKIKLKIKNSFIYFKLRM